MESSKPPSPVGKACAVIGMCGALIISVTLACVGCAQHFALSNDNTPAPTASSISFVAPQELLVPAEAEFTPPPEPEPEPETKPELGTYLATTDDILALSGAEEPFAFSLQEGSEQPSLSESRANAITSATDVFTANEWKSGYLLVDLETGCGIGGNLDERVFGASAIKGPFIHFMCERWLDTGKASLDDEITIEDETMTLLEAIEDAVLKSGNTSYRVLFNTYGSGWATWLSDLGIDSEIDPYQRNPYYTARESGVMWLEAYRYMNAEGDDAGEHAAWLKDLLADTQVSFMRHAIGSDAVSVISKPGWYATPEGSEYDMDSFCEGGIVSENGHDYLLTVMTDATYKGAIEDEFEDIIQAVWAARSDIAVDQD